MGAPHQRKKILMLGYLPPPYFGPSTAYHALMRSEFARHFDVAFLNITISPRIADIEAMQPIKLLKLLGIFTREVGWLLRRRFDFCCVPVSVNRNAFLKDAALLAVARCFGVPTVLYAHGNNLPDFYNRSTPWVRRIIARTFRNAAGAIVLGERLRFNFEPWLPPERIRVAPIGLEPSEPATASAPHTGVTVLYLGNLVRSKGVFILLEAIARLAPVRPAMRFVFAGDWWSAEDRQEAERFIAQHDLADRIEFAGVVWGQRKWQVLADADLFAFPTFYRAEAEPLVLLEAMQMGLPVVTTSRASIPEIIADGVNGLLVREQDAGDLAEKIRQLADDPALRARMSAANRERFAAFYTHEHYGQRMIEAFEALPAR